MNQQRPPWIAVACAAGSLLMLTACSTICKKNVEECLPIITCQPMDTCVTTNEDAHFEVKAFGPNLTFLWFFEDRSNAVTEVANGSSPQLTVSTNILNRYGSY